jgi:hypothetical protein
MKNNCLVTLLFFFAVSSLHAQNYSACGTEPFKDPWLTEFQKSLDNNALRSADDTILYVPISLHMVGDDQGNGYFPVSRVLTAFCILNEDFAATNIQFYINGDSLNYIQNSLWYSHSDIITGAEMMFANNIANTMNCYIVQDPASNCGYNLPYAGIALNKACIGANDHTWAHEVGHNLSLPHPFLGWEGGITHDGSMPPNFTKPAPTTVTYDYTLFKSVFYPDTTIIDTALVELVDRSNCRDAADGFCDTAPDYIASRWACGIDSNSLVTQHDPDNTPFLSNGRWIMSYSLDNCNTGFSEEQILAMRANLRQQKPGHLIDQTPPQIIADMPGLLSPFDGESVQYNNVELEWEDIDGATHYLVEASRIPSFGFLEIEEMVDTNYLIFHELNNNRKYYWRVRAFNRHNTCQGPSSSSSFNTSELSSTNSGNWFGDIDVIQIDDRLEVKFDLDQYIDELDIDLIDIRGRSLFSKKGINPVNLSVNTSFDISGFSTGVYVLNIKTERWQHTIKTIIRQ